MIIKEILALFDSMSEGYNSDNLEFTLWHDIPMIVVEDSGFSTVPDPEIFARLFETVVNCNKYLELPIISWQVHNFLLISDSVFVAKVLWSFADEGARVGVTLDVGYIIQKKDNIWKIMSVLQPIWRTSFSRKKNKEE
jgi:hypothetical protein